MEDLPEIVRRLLRARGIAEADWESFLKPSLSDLADPAELPGIAEASRVILDAVAAGRRIVVFGDYDCDGVCATAILVETLAAMTPAGAVSPFLPERLGEGYGMGDASVARMLKENPGVGLVVTVDNGINSIDQVAALKERGIEVVVTDHHLPSQESDGAADGVVRLPDAASVVDPKVSAPERLQNLCGAGVAFFLASRLVADARERGLYSGPKLAGPLLVLAGLATVTDIMPLLGQNRILVAEALRNFRACAPLGLKELHYRAARNARGEMTSRDFAFLLGPRINAAGRLASGMDALDLILETSRERVREYALRIDHNNSERKAIEQRMTEEALAKVVPGALSQVIDLPDGHPGVAGIVAARVLERLGDTVPVCVFAGGHGSGRAPRGFNIRDAFVACDEALERYGGHAAAGGFSVKEGKVARFRELLEAHCAQLSRAGEFSAAPVETTDLWLDPRELTLDLADAVSALEPFGEANEEPVFGLRGVSLRDVRQLGPDGRHLSAMVGSDGMDAPLRALWWGHGSRADEVRALGESGPCDLRVTLAISDYGARHVELRVLSIAKGEG